MNSQRAMKNYMLLAALIGLAGISAAPAASVNWTGSGVNDNWSNAANWAGGAPAGNSILFNDADATGVPGSGGTPNNVVDNSLEVLSMKYGQTNGFHTTLIPQGVTLTVRDAVSPVFVVGTDTDTGSVQPNVYATIWGAGALSVSNTSGVLSVRQGGNTSGAHRATLDMQGLDTFVARVSQIKIAADNGNSTSSPQYNRPAGTILFARTNHLYLGGSPGLYVAQAQSNGGSASYADLGETNAIFADSILIGGRKSVNSMLRFNLSFASPFAYFRNLAGTGRSSWVIADGYTQNSGSTGTSGAIDFSGGIIDAMVSTLVVGRGAQAPGTGIGTGSFTMQNGVMDVNTLTLGLQEGGAGRGTANVNGGLLKANTAIEMTAGGSGSTAALNITNGTVYANTITNAGGGASTLAMFAGTLAISNAAGLGPARIDTMYIGDSHLMLSASADGARVFVNTIIPTSSTNNTISVFSLPVMTALPAVFPLVEYTGGSGDGFVLGSLPSPVYGGYISNDSTGMKIYLVVDSGPALLTWNGNISGNWDTGTLNWLAGGLSSKYRQGDSTTFDDTATGTTTVTLATNVTPTGLSVSNPSKAYTFTGAGDIGGSSALIKSGGALLTISNTGTNTFSGGVDIQDGKIRIGAKDDRLPTGTAVTIAALPSAGLELNGWNQTIGSLSGGGLLSLGSGTLSIASGGGNYSGVISGTGSVVKTNTGTQTLTGANTYSGDTLVLGGRLNVGNATGSGTGTGLVKVGTNATLALGAGDVGGSVAAASISNDGTVVFDRTDDFTQTTAITGNGNLTKNNTNLVIIPISNTYTGATTINAGGLRVTHASALGDTTGGTTIQNDATARLELAGGLTLNENIILAQKQTVAGYAPGITNLSGNNVLAGTMQLNPGGSYWIVDAGAGKLTISGTVINTTTSNTRTLWLSGDAEGEWAGALTNGAGSILAVRKDGAGTWTLGGSHTYTGATVLSNGTLRINGTLAGNGPVNAEGGTLSGNGTISGPLVVSANATLAPGNGIGKFTVNNNAALQGVTAMELSKSGSVLTNDQLAVTGTLTAGGTLNVTLSGTVTGGEIFKLFSVGGFAGGFDSVNLPDIGSLTWNKDNLLVDGTISVEGGSSQPVLNVSQSASDLTFTWTGSGFKLQAQTNATGLGGAWYDYQGGAASGVIIPIDPANPSVFFRLISQ